MLRACVCGTALVAYISAGEAANELNSKACTMEGSERRQTLRCTTALDTVMIHAQCRLPAVTNAFCPFNVPDIWSAVAAVCCYLFEEIDMSTTHEMFSWSLVLCIDVVMGATSSLLMTHIFSTMTYWVLLQTLCTINKNIESWWYA